ncbi:NUDIX hydrolase [Streptomyces sp. NPDC006879]|uniref:nucleotide triphosphate diphosphatase NUDT15 n=1 Tax=Streptomyces sp. NPDC006879 TaxID=3364767 RepID=UPI003674AA4C
MPGERADRAFPAANCVCGVGVVVSDPQGRVLLGLGHDGYWELPGGKTDPGESFEEAACRELAEETGLELPAVAISIRSVLLDEKGGVTRLTAAAVATVSAAGEPSVTEPDKIARWDWHRLQDLPAKLYGPSAAVLYAWQPDIAPSTVTAHHYPLA